MKYTEAVTDVPKDLSLNSAWIDHVNRIVSFSPQKNFQRMSFQTHQEMFAHVIELGFEGYGIL